MNDETPAGDPKEVAADTSESSGGHDGTTLDKLLSCIDGLTKRMDSWEAKAKADAEPRAEQPDQVRKPVADRAAEERADSAAKANIQARADGIFQALGSRAPAPMAGEATIDYRARMARLLQRHSPSFAKVDLEDIKHSDAAFSAVEDKVYADAMVASKTPETIPGQLREMVKIDPHTGQRMSVFYGDGTFIGQMRRPARRLTGINTRFE